MTKLAVGTAVLGAVVTAALLGTLWFAPSLEPGLHALKSANGSSGYGGAQGGEWADRGVAPPADMASFVSESPLIIDGTVMSVQLVGNVEGWVDGVIATVTPPANPLEQDLTDTLPMTDAVVRVDHVYRNVTGDEITVGSSIILRLITAVTGDCDPEDLSFHMSYFTGAPGKQFLYGLVHMPDEVSWGEPFSYYGRFSMSGPQVTHTDCPASDIAWTPNLTPAAFRAELEAVIAAIDG